MNIKIDYSPGQWVYLISDLKEYGKGPVFPVKIKEVLINVKEDPDYEDPEVEYKVWSKEEDQEDTFLQSELISPEEAKETLKSLILDHLRSELKKYYPCFSYRVEESTLFHQDPDD